MKRHLQLSVVLVLPLLLAASLHAASLTNIRCEYLENPLGIAAARPRLSWVIAESQSEISNSKSQIPRNQKQTAYQVLVASSEELLKTAKGDLWDSGKVASDQSIHVEYGGKPLASRMECYWKVRVWDQDGNASGWSTSALWTMGLLKPDDWQAKWIGFQADETPTHRNR